MDFSDKCCGFWFNLHLSAVIMGYRDGAAVATNCNHASEYRCSNGRCIASALLNNSVNDCGDNSDEAAFPCRAPLFSCLNNRCIFKDWVLDGKNDCGDGSDEAKLIGMPCHVVESCCPCDEYVPHSQCDNSTCQCSKGFFRNQLGTICHQPTNCNHANAYRCSNGRCIASALLNNSVNDCGDNSDEASVPCRAPLFSCRNNRCALKDWVFDGKIDCGDGSDEAKLIGMPCHMVESCCPCDEYVPHSQCDNGTCQCSKGFFRNQLGTICHQHHLRSTYGTPTISFINKEANDEGDLGPTTDEPNSDTIPVVMVIICIVVLLVVVTPFLIYWRNRRRQAKVSDAIKKSDLESDRKEAIHVNDAQGTSFNVNAASSVPIYTEISYTDFEKTFNRGVQNFETSTSDYCEIDEVTTGGIQSDSQYEHFDHGENFEPLTIYEELQ